MFTVHFLHPDINTMGVTAVKLNCVCSRSTYLPTIGSGSKCRQGPNPSLRQGPKYAAKGPNPTLAKGSVWGKPNKAKKSPLSTRNNNALSELSVEA